MARRYDIETPIMSPVSASMYKELADSIRKIIPELEVTYNPDFRQKIANSDLTQSMTQPSVRIGDGHRIILLMI